MDCVGVVKRAFEGRDDSIGRDPITLVKQIYRNKEQGPRYKHDVSYMNWRGRTGSVIRFRSKEDNISPRGMVFVAHLDKWALLRKLRTMMGRLQEQAETGERIDRRTRDG